MPSTSTLVDSIYTRRVSAGECYPPDSGALNAAAQGMNVNMYRMSRDIGRPMRVFNAFMPW